MDDRLKPLEQRSPRERFITYGLFALGGAIGAVVLNLGWLDAAWDPSPGLRISARIAWIVGTLYWAARAFAALRDWRREA